MAVSESWTGMQTTRKSRDFPSAAKGLEQFWLCSFFEMPVVITSSASGQNKRTNPRKMSSRNVVAHEGAHLLGKGQ
jgi:hypothetical protein